MIARQDGTELQLGALSVRQPWATLLLRGHKRHETRPFRLFRPSEDGKVVVRVLALHASVRADDRVKMGLGPNPDLVSDHKARQVVRAWESLPRGAILGFLAFGPSVPTERLVRDPAAISQMLHRDEVAFGDWRAGRFAWPNVAQVALSHPISWRGSLGVWRWKVPPSEVDIVGRALDALRASCPPGVEVVT